jgi:ABC-type nitrate/sulfonate/bicarbonate transport system substrate-binding protein
MPDPLVVVAGSGLRGMALLGPANSSLRSLSGRVATFHDDPMQILLADVLARYGRAECVEISLMESLADAADALTAGRVQAITTVEPWISTLQEGGAVVLSDGTDVWGPDYPDTVLVARRSYLEAEPQTVIAVIAAMLDAERMIAADPDGALAVVAKRFPLFSPRQLRAGLAGQPPRVDLRGPEGTILGRWPTVRRLAGLPATPVPHHLIDLRCLETALDAAVPPTSSTIERHAHVH